MLVINLVSLFSNLQAIALFLKRVSVIGGVFLKSCKNKVIFLCLHSLTIFNTVGGNIGAFCLIKKVKIIIN